MMSITREQYKFCNLSSESLITLETMVAASKAAHGRDDGHSVMAVSCEFAFELDAFPSQFAHIVETGGS
jgi:hypothetical protein